MVKQNKQRLRDKGFCNESNCMNSQGNQITPIHPDSYETVPPQSRLDYEKIYNLVNEAENVCYACGEYHSIQGRVLRPFSEALQTWIDIEVTINEKIAKEGRMNV